MYEGFTSSIHRKAYHYLVYCLLIVLTAIGFSPHEVQARTIYKTRQFQLVNNWDALCDYKLSPDEYDKVYDIVKTNAKGFRNLDKDESSVVKPTSYTRNLFSLTEPKGCYEEVYEDSTTYKSWLIKHNVLERPVNVTVHTGSPKLSVSLADAGYLGDMKLANRTVFLSLLYKAKNGPIQSNVLYTKGVMGHPANGTPGRYTLQTPQTSWSTQADDGTDYWGTGIDAEFVGDYVGYVTSNVWELYLSEMIDAGIISKDDFPSSGDGALFVEEYNGKKSDDKKSDGKKSDDVDAKWSKSKNVSTYTSTLGHSFTGRNLSEGIKPEEPTYFRNYSDINKDSGEHSDLPNQLTVYEALSYIYNYLSQTDKAMSDTESSIVAFKYGLTRFYRVPEKFKRVVYYAVAKGIIPYDSTRSEFCLEGYLTNGQMYELIYRIANEKARFNFSEVTLTDTEKEFQNKGYSETATQIFNTEVEPLTAIKVTQSKKTANDLEFDEEEPDDSSDGDDDGSSTASINRRGALPLFFDKFTLRAHAAKKKSNDSLKTYYVIKWIDYQYKTSSGSLKRTKNYYTFKAADNRIYVFDTQKFNDFDAALEDGKLKDEFTKAVTGSSSKSENSNITKIKCKKEDAKVNGKEYKLLKLKFEVKAVAATSALDYVTSRFGFFGDSKAVVTGFSTVKGKSGAGGVLNTVISQKALRNLKDIAVIRDKVLVNKKTGVQALFVDDPSYNYALVGNTVFTQSDVIVYSNNDEVYYNLDVILHLLSGSAALKDLGINGADSIQKAIVNLRGSKDVELPVSFELESGIYNNKAFCIQRNPDCIKKSDELGVTKKVTSTKKVFYDIDSIVNGINTVVKTITVDYSPKGDDGSGLEQKDSKPIDVKLVLDLVYSFPNFSESTDFYMDMGTKNAKGSTAWPSTYQEYQDLLFTPPKEGTLAYLWWNYNFKTTNALLNFLFETKDVVYVPSGYVVPHLTVLMPDHQTESIFDVPGWKEPSDWKDDVEITYGGSDTEPAIRKTVKRYQVGQGDHSLAYKWNLHYGEKAKTSEGRRSICDKLLNLATKDLVLGVDDIDNWWETLFHGLDFEKEVKDAGLDSTDASEYVEGTYQFHVYYASRYNDNGGDSSDGFLYYSDKTWDATEGKAFYKYGKPRIIMSSTGKLYRWTQDCTFYCDNYSLLNKPIIEPQKKTGNKISLLVKTRTESTFDVDWLTASESPYTVAVTGITCRHSMSKEQKDADKVESHEGKYQKFAFSSLPTGITEPYKNEPLVKDGKTYKGTKLRAVYRALVPHLDVGTAYNKVYQSTLTRMDVSHVNDRGESVTLRGAIVPTKYVGDGCNKSMGKAVIEAGVYGTKSGTKGMIANYKEPAMDSLKKILLCDGLDGHTDQKKVNDVTVSRYDSVCINTADPNEIITGYVTETKQFRTLVHFKSAFNGKKYFYCGGRVFEGDFSNGRVDKLEDVTANTDVINEIIGDEDEGKEPVTVTLIPRIYVLKDYLQMKPNKTVDNGDDYECACSTPEGNYTHVITGPFKGADRCKQSVYTYSVIQRVIDSMLYKQEAVSDVSAFKTGYRLTIGDLKFINNHGEWVSYPIKDRAGKSLVSKLKAGKVKTVLTKLFGGMYITAEGLVYPLYNYVDPDTVAISALNEVPLENSVNGTLLVNAGQNTVQDVRVKAGSTKEEKTYTKSSKDKPRAKYFSIKFKFKSTNEKNCLYARPLTTDNKEWALLLHNDYIMGGNALSIYNMDLDFRNDDNIKLTLLPNKFNFADNVDTAKLIFQDLYTDTKMHSWFWYLKYTIVYYSMYLVFVVWITRIRDVKKFFKLFYHEETGKIDLLKLSTFGILDLKRDISYNRALAVTLIFAFFDAIIIYAL